MLQQYAHHRGARIQRIDHINCFTPDVQASYDFYTELGFRLTEYTETDDADRKLWAVWMHRKGNVHDLAFTNGRGPRLHHIGVWTASALDIIHICDVMATSGYLANMERGPGRHGISNAFFLYIRDPDGHRIELFTVRLSHRRSRPRADPLVADRPAAADAVGPAGAELVVRGRLGVRRALRRASRCWRRGRSWRRKEASRPRRDREQRSQDALVSDCRGTPTTAATIAHSASVAAMTSAMRMPAMKRPAPLSSEPKSATPMALPVWRIALRTPEAMPGILFGHAPQQRRGHRRDEQT